MRDARETERQGSEPSGEAERQPGVGREAPCRLLIVSDIRFLRESLAEVFARDATFIIVGIAKDVDEALAICPLAQPHLILIDAALPDGPAATRRLRTLQPRPFVVALALAETQAEVIVWAEAGISGYIPRSAALAEIVGYLGEVLRGEQSCSTQIAAGLLRWISSAARGDGESRVQARPDSLTAREQQIAGLICVGLSNKEIARRLNIGLATTKSHVHNLLAKLELQRRGQVAQWSRDHTFRLHQPPGESSRTNQTALAYR
jgi:DNA-binding NarL/FixJ family response regulator